MNVRHGATRERGGESAQRTNFDEQRDTARDEVPDCVGKPHWLDQLLRDRRHHVVFSAIEAAEEWGVDGCLQCAARDVREAAEQLLFDPAQARAMRTPRCREALERK